jgi:glycosyltransferase involved in cell wall biosynthesis
MDDAIGHATKGSEVGRRSVACKDSGYAAHAERVGDERAKRKIGNRDRRFRLVISADFLDNRAMPPPRISIVLPVYNEETILDATLRDVLVGLTRIDDRPSNSEVVVVVNGCTDRSAAIAEDWSGREPRVRIVAQKRPSYGAAIRTGIIESRGDTVVIFNADFYDFGFLSAALPLLERCDCVVGSKVLEESKDERPLKRRAVTRAFNLILRIGFGYRGSDTHGLKAMRREALVPIVRRCVTDREIFDTEFLIRAQRAGLRIIELPVRVSEMRETRYGLVRRIGTTIVDLIRIRATL